MSKKHIVIVEIKMEVETPDDYDINNFNEWECEFEIDENKASNIELVDFVSIKKEDVDE